MFIYCLNSYSGSIIWQGSLRILIEARSNNFVRQQGQADLRSGKGQQEQEFSGVYCFESRTEIKTYGWPQIMGMLRRWEVSWRELDWSGRNWAEVFQGVSILYFMGGNRIPKRKPKWARQGLILNLSYRSNQGLWNCEAGKLPAVPSCHQETLISKYLLRLSLPENVSQVRRSLKRPKRNIRGLVM